ncbi:MAG: ABC transporter permease [Bacteroidaceae bacterium]|nr:ABC transporter permease [Bacteroidaceae bacterium]
MIRHYLRQAWAMMRQNRLFSAIYIVGTGLSVALAMTLFIIFYIKLGPVYPEYNRSRIVYLDQITHVIEHGNNYTAMNRAASQSLCERLRTIEGCEALAMVAGSYRYDFSVNELNECRGLFVNNDFWRVYDFKFVAGGPFGDTQSAAVVVSADFAMELFRATDVVGKEIIVNNTRNRIAGVVESPGGCTPKCYAQFWLPSSHTLCEGEREAHPIIGGFRVAMLCRSSGETAAVIAEVKSTIERLAQEQPEGNSFEAKIGEHWKLALGIEEDGATLLDALSKYIYILLALLFIPSLNLGGMIASRMAGRMDEIGVRKAFGATNGSVLSQVLCENLLLTALGALLGLLLAYLITLSASSWILALFDGRVNRMAPENVITVEMLFNPTIIAITMLLTLVLNLMAAVVPTLFALRKSITYSLYNKR